MAIGCPRAQLFVAELPLEGAIHSIFPTKGHAEVGSLIRNHQSSSSSSG